jgi:hypothetical protein
MAGRIGPWYQVATRTGPAQASHGFFMAVLLRSMTDSILDAELKYP